jgi:hypothetical protein
MHSASRITDTLLDEHVAFLYSTDIFGISDHDLLFTKEAVATEEELSAASEMSDVIQAKVRFISCGGFQEACDFLLLMDVNKWMSYGCSDDD